MFNRFLAFAAIFCVASSVEAQEAFGNRFGAPQQKTKSFAQSAWLDLRQTDPANAKPQVAPEWIEAVTLVPVQPRDGSPNRSIFRIRIAQARGDTRLMLLRLFFDDNPEQQPAVTAWDESGTQVLQSGKLGSGLRLPTSESVVLPMMGVSCVDIDVPGDGTNVRGVYLDWLADRKVAQPLSTDPADVMPAPFSSTPPLHAPEMDEEDFGTVTATLAPETIRIGPTMPEAAAFQFPLESQPLVALVSFEVASARIDAPPEVYVNGENLGPVSLLLPDFADPAYRGETARLIAPMRFRYTGWLRAQKLVPAANLRPGQNDVIVLGAPGTGAAAIRATQIQLKYLWDKSDYLLDPN